MSSSAFSFRKYVGNIIMEEIYQISKKGFDELPLEIINTIRKMANLGYGFKFICNETGKELSKESIIGLLALPIRRTLLEKK